MSRNYATLLMAVFTAVALHAQLIEAQTVSGYVVDSVSGLPVGTGFVVLLDIEGREVARALSDRDGSFVMVAPSAGSYRIRSERIGYQAFTSDPFELALGQALDLDLVVMAQAIVLAAVEVQGQDRCRTNPDEAEETGLVWQEIRKALAATAWDGTQELARYRAYGYRRSWDLSRNEIFSERGSISEGFASQPYSSISVESLVNEGFIVERNDTITYNLPDARVLQHDAFLETHCFHVVRDSLGRPGQLGLAFEPVSEFGLPDVRGALWLDEATSELKELDVSFTDLPHGLEEERAGGTVEFMMLPSGAWVVHRWQVRTPSIRLLTGGTREIGDRSQRIGIVGFNDTGGDVLEVTTREGERLYPPGLAHLQGSVYDASKAAPVSGATIAIVGTEFWSGTDARGEYRLAVPLEGDYSATLTHPSLDSIGLKPPEVDVALVFDQTDSISFLLPHADSVAMRACRYGPAAGPRATVIGYVRTGGSGRAASGRTISARWQVLETADGRTVPRAIERSVRTDDTGYYVLCGLPLGSPVTINAAGARAANILFPRSVGGYLLYARARVPDNPYTRSFRTSHRTWKVDLILTGSRASEIEPVKPRVLSGYVTDSSTKRPIGSVTVTLNATDSTKTRVDGTVDMIDVEWVTGNNVVTAHRNGYEIWTREIWLDEGAAHLELSIELDPLQRPS